MLTGVNLSCSTSFWTNLLMRRGNEMWYLDCQLEWKITSAHDKAGVNFSLDHLAPLGHWAGKSRLPFAPHMTTSSSSTCSLQYTEDPSIRCRLSSSNTQMRHNDLLLLIGHIPFLRSHPKQRQLVLVIYLVLDGTMLRLLTPKKGDHQELKQGNGQKVGVVILSIGIDLFATYHRIRQ